MLTTIFLAASSKYIAFIGVAIVLVFVVIGYSMDIRDRNNRERPNK